MLLFRREPPSLDASRLWNTFREGEGEDVRVEHSIDKSAVVICTLHWAVLSREQELAREFTIVPVSCLMVVSFYTHCATLG